MILLFLKRCRIIITSVYPKMTGVTPVVEKAVTDLMLRLAYDAYHIGMPPSEDSDGEDMFPSGTPDGSGLYLHENDYRIESVRLAIPERVRQLSAGGEDIQYVIHSTLDNGAVTYRISVQCFEYAVSRNMVIRFDETGQNPVITAEECQHLLEAVMCSTKHMSISTCGGGIAYSNTTGDIVEYW